MAGYSRRFDKSYRNAKANLEAAVRKPFMVRSTAYDLIDNAGFLVKYTKLNGGMFVDAAIRDIDLSLFYMGEDLIPKSCFAIDTIAHHPELKELNDVDNGVGVVEYHGGKRAYFYYSRTQAHGHDSATEIVGTSGKISINLVPKVDEVVYADKDGWRHKVQPEYWERFEHAFATEANEFVACIFEETKYLTERLKMPGKSPLHYFPQSVLLLNTQRFYYLVTVSQNNTKPSFINYIPMISQSPRSARYMPSSSRTTTMRVDCLRMS